VEAMMIKKPTNRVEKRKYWKKIVSDWEDGDFKTQKEFCQHVGISGKTLSRWLRVFSQENQLTEKTSLGFANVHVQKASNEKSGVRIAVHHGVYIDISNDFDAPTLQRVLGMML